MGTSPIGTIMNKIPLILAATACLLAGCDDENPTQKALNANRAKWAAADLDDYVFERSQTSFSIPEEAIVVTVNDGVVTSAFFTPSGVMLSAERQARLRTIEGYFDFVQNAINDNAFLLNVIYDDTYGFPADIVVDFSQQVADDEIGLYIRNFQ